MPRPRREADAALQAVYDQIPAIPDCTGQCWISCGPIDMTSRERQRIRARGYRISQPDKAAMSADTFWCEALTGDKRCAVYEMRPFVCRIWGAVEDMKCPFGCVPEGGWLSSERGWELMAAVREIGGESVLDHEPSAAAFRAALAIGSRGVRLRTRQAVPEALRRPAPQFPCPACGFQLHREPGQAPSRGICGHCGAAISIPGDGRRY